MFPSKGFACFHWGAIITIILTIILIIIFIQVYMMEADSGEYISRIPAPRDTSYSMGVAIGPSGELLLAQRGKDGGHTRNCDVSRGYKRAGGVKVG